MSHSPLVAVTATTEIVASRPRVRLNEAYVRALVDAGLVPLVAPPLEDDRAADAVLAAVSGLVLTGGEDVAPSLYGAAPHPALGGVHDGRDRWEAALVRAARARRLPTLAICRGIQVLNVALGGTLVQDLPSERPTATDHDPKAGRDARTHTLRLEPGSRLAQALDADGETVRINSLHHQAVDRLGDGLRATGTSDDGVVEGVETDDAGWWALGVQWHPEELTATPEGWDRALFAAFAARCGRSA